MRGRSSQRAFTLLELLVALGIFGIMSVLAYGGLNSVIETREHATQALDDLARLQRMVHRIQFDLESTQHRAIRDEFGDLRPALLWDDTRNGLELTRGGWRNPLSLPRSSMERVAYFLEEDRLVRRSWRVLDRAQDSAYVDTELLDGVEALRMRFLKDGDEWVTEWPGANVVDQNPAPPRAVEVIVETRQWDEIRLLLRLPPGAGAAS